MIVVACTGIGVLSALWSWARVKRLAEIRLRHVELVWFALVLQVVLFEWIATFSARWVTEGLHYATYALTAWFIVLNRHIPGTLLIAFGAGCNLLAIAANGGSMPADSGAWERAGLPPVPVGAFENSAAQGSARLAFLGDIFAIPEAWPLSNVFSVGDVLIVIGGTYFAHRWCAQRPSEAIAAPDDLSLTPA